MLYPQQLKPSIKNTLVRSIFTRLDYPLAIINSTISKTIQSFSYGTREKNNEVNSVARVSLLFKDQTTANAVKRQMRDLSHKIGTKLQLVFISRKLDKDLKPREIKSPIINQECVVHSFTRDLCDSDYVGCTVRHLHQGSLLILIQFRQSDFSSYSP